MKKISFILFFTTTIITQNICSQDFNLYVPSSEMFLFTAYDEGALGFRNNPAVLGLKHRFNVSLSGFLENYRGKVYLNEGDISINTGILGLAYRYSHPGTGRGTISQPNYSYDQNSFYIALGFGNKTISGGLSYETNSRPDYDEFYRYQVETKSKNRFGFGLLYRPFKFLSTALVIKSPSAYLPDQGTAVKYSFGSAVRLLGNDLLTFLVDFSILPYYGEIFERNQLKVGVDLKVRNGIYINGNYGMLNAPEFSDFINFGLRFDMPHSSVKYNNTFTRYDNHGDYNEDLPFKSQGNYFALSYSMERKETIVPEDKKVLEITLSGSLQDYNTEDVFFGVFGQGKRSVHEIIADIDAAAADKSIRGLLLKVYPLSTGRFEINAAIE